MGKRFISKTENMLHKQLCVRVHENYAIGMYIALLLQNPLNFTSIKNEKKFPYILNFGGLGHLI